MNSMTGFGKADVRTKNLSVSVEAHTVNNRYLEYSLRMPKQLYFLEPKIKEIVAGNVSRGKITLSISYSDLGVGLDKLTMNETLAKELHNRLISLKKKYKLSGDIDINHFVAFPEIFRIEKDDNLEKLIWPALSKALTKAIDELVRMRKREGVNLKKDLAARLKLLSSTIAKVEKLALNNVAQYREKLSKRINEVLADKSINSDRLEEEVAYMAEKADITEECVRFHSHIKQFAKALSNAKPIGKRLNFILQEFNREANTIGSKSGDSGISASVLILKEEIEKMREQVQNIE